MGPLKVKSKKKGAIETQNMGWQWNLKKFATTILQGAYGLRDPLVRA